MVDHTGRRFELSAEGRLAVAVSSVLAGVQPAQAQSALEEIIVTATKRQASLQDIPQAITAFTSDDIQRRGFEGLDDYAAFVPSLSFGRREPGGTSVVFRGVAASGIQFGTNPSSGVYLDEQPITAAGLNPDPRLVDIERIEALSGPQGTLFGDASQSGTLRIITNKPDEGEFDAWVDTTLTTVDDGEQGYDLSAMVNVPLVRDTLALRLVGFSSEEAGFIDNVLGPSPGGTFDNADRTDDDTNTAKYWGGRAALRWLPNDDWTVDLSGIYQDVQVDGFGDVNPDVGKLEQVRFEKEQLDEHWYQLALTAEGSLGFADVMATGSYFDRKFDYDADATDYQFAFNAYSDYAQFAYNSYLGYDPGDPYYVQLDFYDFGGDPRAKAFNGIDLDRTTFEARLSTPASSESRWQGIVGVFYNKTESSAYFAAGNDAFAGSPAFYYLAYNPYQASLNGLPPGSWDFTDNWFFGVYDTTVEQKAVFGEATFDVTENFSITAGGRWFDVDREFSLFQGALQQSSSPDRATDFVTTDETSNSNETDFVPKINLTYRIRDDKLVYVTYNEGFRSGGANAVRPSSIISREYSSDKLKNFEVGAKTQWLEGRLQFNLTAYTMVWDDIQVQVNDPQPAVFAIGIENFPEAEIKGVEADMAWIPAEGLDLYATVAYIDAEISKTATLFPDSDNPITAFDGAKLPLTPDWKASASIQYTFQRNLFGAEPFARFDVAYVGESVNALTGVESIVFAPPANKQDDYTTGDLRAGLDAEQWSLTFSVDNLWDERAQQFYNNRWAKQRLSINRPRTFGVNFRWRF